MRTLIAALVFLATMTHADAGPYRAGEVRPWQAYVQAKNDLRDAGLNAPDEYAPFMIGRLGPLPWRFRASAETPFDSDAEVTRLYTHYDARMGSRGAFVTRVHFEYPGTAGALKAEDTILAIQFQNVSPRYDGSKCSYRFADTGFC